MEWATPYVEWYGDAMNLHTDMLDRLCAADVKTHTRYETRNGGWVQYQSPPLSPSWVHHLASLERNHRYRLVAILDASSVGRQMVHSLHVARSVVQHRSRRPQGRTGACTCISTVGYRSINTQADHTNQIKGDDENQTRHVEANARSNTTDEWRGMHRCQCD